MGQVQGVDLTAALDRDPRAADAVAPFEVVDAPTAERLVEVEVCFDHVPTHQGHEPGPREHPRDVVRHLETGSAGHSSETAIAARSAAY